MSIHSINKDGMNRQEKNINGFYACYKFNFKLLQLVKKFIESADTSASFVCKI